MGTAAFERDAVVEIDGQKYRLLRKVSETCWQLEHTSTARISELEQFKSLRPHQLPLPSTGGHHDPDVAASAVPFPKSYAIRASLCRARRAYSASPILSLAAMDSLSIALAASTSSAPPRSASMSAYQ